MSLFTYFLNFNKAGFKLQSKTRYAPSQKFKSLLQLEPDRYTGFASASFSFCQVGISSMRRFEYQTNSAGMFSNETVVCEYTHDHSAL